MSGGTLQEYIRQKIRIEQKQSLLGLIEAAADMYRSLSVKRKKDAEDLWRKNNNCAALREAMQDLQQLEVQWDAFLQHLDDELQLSAEILDREHQSKYISPDTSLTDARTGETVTLNKYLEEGRKTLLVLIRQFSCLLCRLHLKELEKNQRSLDAHFIKVVVVSFGCQEGASHWLQETGCQYDMLLDPERKVYAAFGLGAYLKKVLNFSNMLHYAEYVVDNMEFPRGLPLIQDDMFQLGGDFVLDEQGRVLFSHRCQSPIDRPSVEDILSAQ
ncbi:prostamide/prostaglandin F synthase-like isoform X2 [Centropristis striata]|uniref:prostamide/prostaglandin F synthase-like isoform X2 n=1 Tax=Centropristis striata TaxID=184440 RepID=UPI0027E17F31|nr:prostamide/prostaglandin F synthase-like isoform X2 [Centropristis striata]